MASLINISGTAELLQYLYNSANTFPTKLFQFADPQARLAVTFKVYLFVWKQET
jgi:hypothetical protein